MPRDLVAGGQHVGAVDQRGVDLARAAPCASAALTSCSRVSGRGTTPGGGEDLARPPRRTAPPAAHSAMRQVGVGEVGQPVTSPGLPGGDGDLQACCGRRRAGAAASPGVDDGRHRRRAGGGEDVGRARRRRSAARAPQLAPKLSDDRRARVRRPRTSLGDLRRTPRSARRRRRRRPCRDPAPARRVGAAGLAARRSRRSSRPRAAASAEPPSGASAARASRVGPERRRARRRRSSP